MRVHKHGLDQYCARMHVYGVVCVTTNITCLAQCGLDTFSDAQKIRGTMTASTNNVNPPDGSWEFATVWVRSANIVYAVSAVRIRARFLFLVLRDFVNKKKISVCQEKTKPGVCRTSAYRKKLAKVNQNNVGYGW
jgi:hypothetical protein